MPKYQALYPGQPKESVSSSMIIEYENDEKAIFQSTGLVENGDVEEAIVVRCGHSPIDQRVIARIYRGQPKTTYETEVVRY